MSREDQYGPALKRARRALIALDGKDVTDGVGGVTAPVVLAEREAALAQVEETARLADEQRTANLIALAHEMGWAEWQINGVGMVEVICKRLGVEHS